MEAKGKQKAKRPSSSSESSAEDPYSSEGENEVEQTLRITQEHERNYQLSQSSVKPKTPCRSDPNLLFFLLGHQTIRDNLLFYVTDRDLASLSRTCGAMNHVVVRAYLPGIRRFRGVESFKKFSVGCWETLNGEVAFADRTSIVYHLMNETTKRKFCVFYGQNFVALPRIYLEDLLRVAWTSLALASRSRCPNRRSSYALVSAALSDSRSFFRTEASSYYVMGDRYLFSHEFTTPFQFDVDIPKRSSALFYLKGEKTELALYALLGRLEYRLDEHTNARLRAYNDVSKGLKERIIAKVSKLPLVVIDNQKDLYEYYSEWEFSIKTHESAPIRTIALSPSAEKEKEENGSCIIS